MLQHILFEFSVYEAAHNAPYKARAYQSAAETVSQHADDLETLWKAQGIKGLKELPGIGTAIAEKIDEFFRTGRIASYRTMKQAFPVDSARLSTLEGLGPKHIFTLWQKLKIKNLSDLEHALQHKKIAQLPGFGEASQARLARALHLKRAASGRPALGFILPIAEELVAHLTRLPDVTRSAYGGSIRRRQETVGDIDLIATSNHPIRVMEAFVHFPEVDSVIEQGPTRTLVRLHNGLDADLRVVPDQVFGATLLYFTGSKQHNILLRERALKRGYTLNEYGLFKGKKLLACAHEEEIYTRLGLDMPPPELRVGGEELLAAEHHALPDLLPYGSVRGDLQVQTNWTDGSDSIEQMARAARTNRLSYMAVTDHTKALTFIHGLHEREVTKQGKEIDRLNKKYTIKTHARLLHGTECDILRDGTLDLNNATLSALDWVGVSVHTSLELEATDMTKRIVKALSNPNIDCFFHPTSRRIGRREPCAMDMDEVLATAKKFRVALEIDATPDRSDLNDLHVRSAIRAGVPLVIDSDAHSPDHFRFLNFGEGIARRGWATKTDIMNTKTLTQLRAWLEKKRPRPQWTA